MDITETKRFEVNSNGIRQSINFPLWPSFTASDTCRVWKLHDTRDFFKSHTIIQRPVALAGDKILWLNSMTPDFISMKYWLHVALLNCQSLSFVPVTWLHEWYKVPDLYAVAFIWITTSRPDRFWGPPNFLSVRSPRGKAAGSWK